MLADEDVEMVISGKFGPNIIGIFESKEIPFKEMPNLTVKEALRKIEQ
jgi:predicted Fe-Mo cluster-binding NifX family protein